MPAQRLHPPRRRFTERGAFGDEPIVIYKGERLRWVNADALTHVIVSDSPDTTDFRTLIVREHQRTTPEGGMMNAVFDLSD